MKKLLLIFTILAIVSCSIVTKCPNKKLDDQEISGISNKGYVTIANSSDATKEAIRQLVGIHQEIDGTDTSYCFVLKGKEGVENALEICSEEDTIDFKHYLSDSEWESAIIRGLKLKKYGVLDTIIAHTLDSLDNAYSLINSTNDSIDTLSNNMSNKLTNLSSNISNKLDTVYLNLESLHDSVYFIGSDNKLTLKDNYNAISSNNDSLILGNQNTSLDLVTSDGENNLAINADNTNFVSSGDTLVTITKDSTKISNALILNYIKLRNRTTVPLGNYLLFAMNGVPYWLTPSDTTNLALGTNGISIVSLVKNRILKAYSDSTLGSSSLVEFDNGHLGLNTDEDSTGILNAVSTYGTTEFSSAYPHIKFTNDADLVSQIGTRRTNGIGFSISQGSTDDLSGNNLYLTHDDDKFYIDTTGIVYFTNAEAVDDLTVDSTLRVDDKFSFGRTSTVPLLENDANNNLIFNGNSSLNIGDNLDAKGTAFFMKNRNNVGTDYGDYNNYVALFENPYTYTGRWTGVGFIGGSYTENNVSACLLSQLTGDYGQSEFAIGIKDSPVDSAVPDLKLIIDSSYVYFKNNLMTYGSATIAGDSLWTNSLIVKDNATINGNLIANDTLEANDLIIANSDLNVEGDINESSTINITNTTTDNGILVTAGSADKPVLRAQQNSTNPYGWELMYGGSGSGNNNTFQLNMDNQTSGSTVNAMTVTQDGDVTFSQDVDVEGTLTVDALSFSSLTLSGTLKAEQITSTDDATINDDLTVGGIVKAEQLTSTDDASISDDLTVGGDVTVGGTVTADPNYISIRCGSLYGNTISYSDYTDNSPDISITNSSYDYFTLAGGHTYLMIASIMFNLSSSKGYGTYFFSTTTSGSTIGYSRATDYGSGITKTNTSENACFTLYTPTSSTKVYLYYSGKLISTANSSYSYIEVICLN